MDDPCVYAAHARCTAALEQIEQRARHNPTHEAVNALAECAAEIAWVRHRLGNPTLPRFAYIAKRYPRPVLAAVINAWGEATGLHAVKQLGLLSDLSSEQLVEAVGTQAAQSQIPEVRAGHTRYDKYLPWLAAQINADHKRRLRDIRRLATQPPKRAFDAPGREDGWRARLADVQDLDAARRILDDVDPVRRRILTQPILAGFANNIELAEENFRVIVDWAEAMRVDLSTTDFVDAARTANDWAAAQEMDEYCDPPPQGTVVYRWKDGWTVQRLETDEQLRCEGALQRHCVGDYCHEMQSGERVFFSLRDADGRPRVTMEWDPETLQFGQVRAFANHAPDDEGVILRLVAFRERCPVLSVPWTKTLPKKSAVAELPRYVATYAGKVRGPQGRMRKAQVHIFENRDWGTLGVRADTALDVYLEEREARSKELAEAISEWMSEQYRLCDEDEDEGDEGCISEDTWIWIESNALQDALGPWEAAWAPDLDASGASLTMPDLSSLLWRAVVDPGRSRDAFKGMENAEIETGDGDELVELARIVVRRWHDHDIRPFDRGRPVRCKRG